MLRVYLDDTVQAINDVKDIAESFEVSIIREGGQLDTFPILREKTDANLRFLGASYRYICNKRRTAFCTPIDVRIVYECDGESTDIFIGLLFQKEIDIDPTHGIAIAKTIRDNSFSGKFRDIFDVQIPFYYTQTKNCDDLELISETYIFSTDPADVGGSQVNKVGYDSISAIQYILNYFTDNTVTVVSDYLTTNQYAIFKVFPIHTSTGTITDMNPNLSISEIFEELRKKLNLSMAIEYDNNNAPYLRIEQNSYFYSTDVLFEIIGIPNGLIESINTDQQYRNIKVGSTITDVDTGTVYYPQEKETGWIEGNYTNCGDCTGDKDKELDTVSNFIIESNVIYEALNIPDGDSYTYDSDYILVNYYTLSGQNYVQIDTVDGDNIYNYSIINSTVLSNWVNDTQGCIASQRSANNAFEVFMDDTVVASYVVNSPTPGGYTQDNANGTVSYDNNSNITTAAINNANLNPYSPSFGGGTLPNTTTYFTVPTDQSYRFTADFDMYVSTNGYPAIASNMDYVLKISVYTDNTFNTLVSEYTSTEADVNLEENRTYRLSVDTGLIALTTGNTVMVKVITDTDGLTLEDVVLNVAARGLFRLIDDSSNCVNVESNTSARIFEVDFKREISLSEYLAARQNKKGLVIVNNIDYHIQELKYVPRKLSTFKLIGKESICSC